MAYLGRISAVLTANTADFTRNIGDARRELNAFAQGVRNIEVRLNTRSLDETLTRLQRFTRTLDEIRDLQARGIDLGLPDPNRLRDQFRAYEDLGRGLTRVKDGIESLSTAAQAGLLPALERIQVGFRNVYTSIQEGTSTYAAQRNEIERLRDSLQRLSRQQSAVGDIGGVARRLDVDNTGASFVQPLAMESLQRTLALRGQAEQVPARFRGGIFDQLSQEAQRSADLIEQQAARVARAQLEYADGFGSQAAVAASQRRLNGLVRDQQRIAQAFETELRSASIEGIISPQAQSEAATLTARYEELAQSLRKVDGTRFESLIASVGRIVEGLNRARVTADQARSAIDALESARAADGLVRQGFSDVDARLRTASERERRAINRSASDQLDVIRSQPTFSPRQAALVDIRERIGLERERFGRADVGGIESLQRSAERLDDTRFRRGADRIRARAAEANDVLRRAFEAQVPADAQRLFSEYEQQLVRLRSRIDNFRDGVERATDAQQQFNAFLQASGGVRDKPDPVLVRAASDITVVRQTAGQFAAGNIAGRQAVATQTAQVEREINRLIAQRVALEQQSSLTEAERARLLAANSDEIRQQTIDLLNRTAAESGGIVSPEQLQARADMAARNTGSFGAAGFNTIQLAAQQGLFAIDDFVSATGGLEFKLRAVGNNITQLGLLLGQSGVIPWLSATRGLFLGLAAILGTQAILAISRWGGETEKASDKANALNEALNRQRDLAKEVADAFKDISDSISGRGFSSAAREAVEALERIRSATERSRQFSESRIADVDQRVVSERTRQATLRGQIESETDIGRNLALRSELAASIQREREFAQAAISRPAESPSETIRAVIESIQRFGFEREQAAFEAGATAGSRSVGFDGFPVTTGLEVGAMRASEARAQTQRELEAARSASVSDAAEAILFVEKRLSELRSTATREDAGSLGFLVGDTGREREAAAKEFSELSQLLARLRLALDRELVALSSSIRNSAAGVSRGIEAAQGDFEEAIRRGVPAASEFQSAANNTARQLKEALDQLDAAALIEDPTIRRREIERAQGRVRDLQLRAGAIDEAAREARLGRAFGGERTTAALSGIQGNERFANELARLQAVLASAIDAEVQARRNLEAAIASGDDALQQAAREELKAAQAASELAAAAGEAAVALEGAFGRIRQSAVDIEDGFRSLADQAQRDLAERLPVSEGGLPESQLRANRDAAELELIGAARRVQELQNRLDQERVSIGEDPRVREIDRRAEELRSQAQAAAERARVDGVQEDSAAARARADELARLEEERARIVFNSTAATRAAIDAEQQLIEDRRRAIEEARRAREFEVDRRRRRDPVGDPFAGLDALESEQEAVRRQFAQTIANINAASDLIAENILAAANGLPGGAQNEELRQNEAARQRALDQVGNQQLQSILQATSALQRFEDALNEASQEVQSDARQAEARASEARRRQQFLSTPLNDFEARTAEVNARRQRDLADRAQLAIDQERSRLQEQARQGVGPIAGLVQELSRIDEALSSAQGGERARLEAERRRVQADIDRQVELSPEVRRAREAASREADRQAAAAQGRRVVLQQNPILGAQQSIAETFAAIDAAFEEFARGIIDAAGGLPRVDARVRADLDANEQRRQNARRRAVEDLTDIGLTENEQARRRIQDQLGPLEAQAQQLIAGGNRAEAARRLANAQQNLARDAAPLLFGFRDEVANAVLQGPSRAALQVADASTTEGQRELNRLLRGDDPARDVNFLELQKQSELLAAVRDGIAQLAARLGIAL